MARANTITKLPLDRWAEIMGLNPIHFNGVYVRAPTVCAQPWLQFAHQANDRVGREEVAQAIAQAEADIERELGYFLLPTWITDEWRPITRPWRPENFNLSATDVRGLGGSAKAGRGYLISGGIRSKESVAEGVTISYSDEDGDDYDETAEIQVSVSFTDPGEIAIYFEAGGPVAEAGEDAWEIRPTQATISGGVATIRARREQFVIPALQSRIVPPASDSHLRGVDGAEDSNFVTEVDVYRVYNDPQRQVQFLWQPTGCLDCSGAGCAACSFRTQYGCLSLREDPRHSHVVYHPAAWNPDTLQFEAEPWAVARQPDLVRLWYYSGWRNKGAASPTRVMDPTHERMVAYYAAGLLDRPICECNNVSAFTAQWREDLTKISMPTGAARAVIPQALECPFGTTRGALFAWQRLDNSVGGGALP